MTNLPNHPCARCGVAPRNISSYCYPCHTLNGKESRERNGGAKRYHMKRRYNMTLEQYNEILANQDYECPICFEPNPTHIDHDHVGTGEKHRQGEKVRGVLCTSCNNGLGLFKDDAERLRKAADYLDRTA